MASQPSLAADRPNIVLILADDLGYETLGSYGGTSYQTPNLDRLAATGMRFNHAYATPLCTPTRLQLMTGKYNHRNWVAFGIMDPKERTFGHYLQAAGYKTCMVGKWQFTSYDPPDYPGASRRRSIGMRVQDAGFDEYSLWHTGHTEDKGSRYADPVIFQNGQFLKNIQGKYGEDIWAEYAGDFIERHRNIPFFLYYSMALTHDPFVPTPDSPEWRNPPERHRPQTRYFKDMVEYMDKIVGRLVAGLDRLGLREKTLILFYSDNGTLPRVISNLGAIPVRGGKGLMTDAGTRVPLIANWQGVTPKGAVSNDLVDSTDFLPTFTEAAQYALPPGTVVDGRSFLPQLRGKKGQPREWIYLHHDPRPAWDKDRFHLERFARSQRFKLYDDGRLFYVPADVLEEKPLLPKADTPELAAARRQLQQVLDSMKPFPMFSPEDVPWKDPVFELFKNHSFRDSQGTVIIEAETIPLPRDESWRFDSAIPGFTGTGYLIALRDSPCAPVSGVLSIPVVLNTTGKWNLAVRTRKDHPDGQLENDCWLRLDNGPWKTVANMQSIGEWSWTTAAGNPEQESAGRSSLTFDLQEGKHTLWIAPRSRSFKVDRLVFYQEDRTARALDPVTPQSDFHSW
jgi:arylsulfatase A-like enzyme